MRLALDSRTEREFFKTWGEAAVVGDEDQQRVVRGKDPDADSRVSLTASSHTLDARSDIRKLRRTIAAVLVGLVLVIGAPAYASEHPRVDRCRGISSVGTMVRCVARSFDSPGTPRYAQGIARCESGLHPRDVSMSGRFVGLFQHVRTQWISRWQHWGRPVGVGSAWWNGLSAAVVSVRMARVTSWSPWTCSH